jgi:23S rRNA (guanosine2251-2'-O)-methyltransferase
MRPRERSPGGRSRSERELLAGLHPIREALRARRRRVRRLILRAQDRDPRPELRQLLDLARELAVPAEELPPARFDALAPAGVAHQGVLLEAGPLPVLEIDDLIDAGAESSWLVALDGIEDPQNLGAILRVAEAAGARGAILPDRRSAPLSAAVGRASAGAVEHLPIASVANLPRALELLKRHGYWVHAAEPDAAQDLFELSDHLLEGRLVLVLGAEGKGLRPGVRAAVDVCARIPMAGSVASLNVASAAAVVLFEWRRRARARAAAADASTSES